MCSLERTQDIDPTWVTVSPIPITAKLEPELGVRVVRSRSELEVSGAGDIRRRPESSEVRNDRSRYRLELAGIRKNLGVGVAPSRSLSGRHYIQFRFFRLLLWPYTSLTTTVARETIYGSSP